MGGKRIRGLKSRMGWKCCISKRGPDDAMEVHQIEESEEEITVLVGVANFKKSRYAAGRVVSEMKAAKSSESRKGEHFNPLTDTGSYMTHDS